MASRSTNTSKWLHFATFFIYCWSVQVALAVLVNVTIDDTDPMIFYTPPGSWHSSSVSCPGCLNPDTRDAFQNTYHHGTHIPSPPDNDSDDDDDDDNDKSKTIAKRQEGPKSTMAPGALQRRSDSDSPNAGVMVSAHFNFTGSAVYLYCIQPLGTPLVDTTPTAMNLSFTLDNNLLGNFSHQGSQSASGYAFHVNVFAQTNIMETPHVLRVDIGLGSVFLFDYMIYTRDDHNDTVPNSSSPNVDEHTKKHNIATFAGAVGGSAGVLGVISLCLAFSIIKRRRNYKRRERRERDRSSLHTNASDDSPPMLGPAPFIPRFFPGTQIPSISSDPPSYIESMSNPSSLSPSSLGSTSLPLLSSTMVPTAYPTHLQDTSFADVPPALPPPVDDVPLSSLDETILPPPPPFDAAIATVLPADPPLSAASDSAQGSSNVIPLDPVPLSRISVHSQDHRP